jgi:DNA modification methylase
MAYGASCGKCGAKRVDLQLGLEPTPDEYVANLVAVFREVKRVLRDDGTLWLNLGDSYARGFGGGTPGEKSSTNAGSYDGRTARTLPTGLKGKDLVGIPWMVAFALRADGWYLRSEVIWAKPNPMPESVTDRPTRAHEQVFLLSKSARYFYDSDAVREPSAESTLARADCRPTDSPKHLEAEGNHWNGSGPTSRYGATGANKRSVWNIATAPFPGAHFAVFPPKLVEPMVLAGSADRACGVCGSPWVRQVEATAPDGRTARVVGGKAYDDEGVPLMGDNMIDHGVRGAWNSGGVTLERRTVGWEPSCDHQDDTGASTVLDPFCGAGTTGVVALRRDRSFIGLELNPAYAELARQRIRDDAPLFNNESEQVA